VVAFGDLPAPVWLTLPPGILPDDVKSCKFEKMNRPLPGKTKKAAANEIIMTVKSYRSRGANLLVDIGHFVARTREPFPSGTAVGILIAAIALVAGAVTAGDYGITIDEFNTEDYGRKALAWYTSGFTDRASFETVEPPLWYYGPWFQMLIAWVQSWGAGDPLTIRHALTYAAGLCGLGALLPLGLGTYGAWAGTAALTLCLTTGYLYGSLFFTPIDVPFLAAMSWATVAIIAMATSATPTWPATACAGILTGLAIASRAGGIITHAYLVGAMALCAAEAWLHHGRSARPQLLAIGGRTLAAIGVAWLTAIVLWPWLQIGNPFLHFWMAVAHFAKVPTSFEFQSWGEQLTTDDLPWTYIPAQLAARLPMVFLLLLAAAAILAVCNVGLSALHAYRQFRQGGLLHLREPLMCLRVSAARWLCGRRRSCRSHYSLCSIRRSTTASATSCSSFRCLACWPAAHWFALRPSGQDLGWSRCSPPPRFMSERRSPISRVCIR
jgi:hypothetical protein